LKKYYSIAQEFLNDIQVGKKAVKRFLILLQMNYLRGISEN